MAIFNTMLARENWISKYRYAGETELETFQRVAAACAEAERNYGGTDEDVEAWTDRFLKTLVDFESVPEGTEGEDVYVDPEGLTWRSTGLRATTGGRITANAGTDFKNATLLNCFIQGGVKGAKISYEKVSADGKHQIPVIFEGNDETADDLVNIMTTLTAQALTLSNEGGYGINFDFIRPRSSLIKGTGVRHPGVVAYMEVWDKVAEMIVRGDQDGYSDTLTNHLPQKDLFQDELEKAMPRKGAQMGCLSVWHPDIEEFVRAKQTQGKLTKFNISVVVDDAFMEAVESDGMYDLHFEGRTYKRIKARELYDLIMDCTFKRAEPGILFYDNINKANPIVYLGDSNSTNPCGEIDGNPLTTTVCLLGSINLPKFVKKDRSFDWESYAETIKTFARMLENVNDIGNVPLPDYQWALQNVRQYGMGVNGLGSSMYMMGLKYGSQESLDFVDKVNSLKENLTWQVSSKLAAERGPAPAFDEEAFFSTPWWESNEVLTEETKALMQEHGVRNLKTTTNPPLGNSSVICDMVSNGIEPVFAHGYERTVIVDKWPEGLNQDNVRDLLTQTTAGDATVWKGEHEGRMWYYEPHNRGLCYIDEVVDYGYDWVREFYPSDIEEGAEYLATAQDLKVDAHVSVQAQVQRNINQACSKTVNLPNDYPFEDFKDLYLKAWKAGLKGFTTYRAGTMEAVLATKSDDKPTAPAADSLLELLTSRGYVPEDVEVTEEGVVVREVYLPDSFSNGETRKIKADGNKYYLHLSYLPDDETYPIALWIHSNGLQAGEYVSLNRAVRSVTKLLLNKGVDSDLVLDQVDKVKDDLHHVKLGKMIGMALRHCIPLEEIIGSLSDIEGDHIASTVTAVRKFLKMHMDDGVEAVGVTCEACGSENVIYEGGCDKCLDCGASGCS